MAAAETVGLMEKLVVIIVLIGLLADRILFSPWERFLHRRWARTSGKVA